LWNVKYLYCISNIKILMGNKTTQVLPAVITKNWHPLSPDGDIYHNKLTDEYVR
jgi:hypothetical protein